MWAGWANGFGKGVHVAKKSYVAILVLTAMALVRPVSALAADPNVSTCEPLFESIQKVASSERRNIAVTDKARVLACATREPYPPSGTSEVQIDSWWVLTVAGEDTAAIAALAAANQELLKNQLGKQAYPTKDIKNDLSAGEDVSSYLRQVAYLCGFEFKTAPNSAVHMTFARVIIHNYCEDVPWILAINHVALIQDGDYLRPSK